MPNFYIEKSVIVCTTGQHRGEYSLFSLVKTEEFNDREYERSRLASRFNKNEILADHASSLPAIDPAVRIDIPTVTMEITENDYHSLGSKFQYGGLKRSDVNQFFN